MKVFAATIAAAMLMTRPSLAQQTEVIRDYDVFATGSWTGYIAPYNRGSLVFGQDYTESDTLKPSTFPNGSRLAWAWPNTNRTSPYGDNTVQFGDYDGTHPPVPIPSKQIGSIGTLKLMHQSSIAGMLSGFDVIIDTFLTSQPGSAPPHVWEIEVFLHTPRYAAAFVRSGKPIGTVSISGRSWIATITGGNDILFMPVDQSDALSGTIDLKEMIFYLLKERVLTRSLYFNGVAYGVETEFGSGLMNINKLSVTYD